ncbi:LapA family protein [Nocardia elegans]|uniref:LapA family protein n=1 Tax=Nocardia elegans TaxID=300029 RepID=UPI002B4AB199|nr:LapA family protein [Nocardia elegans]
MRRCRLGDRVTDEYQEDAMDRAAKPSLLSRISARQWVAIVLAVLAVIFVAQNHHRVDINILAVTIQSPMWLVLLIMFLVGWIAGLLTRRSRR